MGFGQKWDKIRQMAEDSYICPTCDSEVKVGGSCPGCAPKPKRSRKKKKVATSGTKRSWERDEAYDGLDFPDEDFDYDEFVKKEFSSKPHERIGIKLYWWLTAVVLLTLLIWLIVF